MNYAHLLIDSVCNLSETNNTDVKSAYDRMQMKPDNFTEGYPIRYMISDGMISDLSGVLSVFYDNTFKYKESTSCEGYDKLIEFLYKIDGVDTGKIVEKLDDIANSDALYDIEGNRINDDDDIREMRNANFIFGIKQMLDETVSDDDIWDFINNEYRDSKKVMHLLSESNADDAGELLSEWIACNEEG